MQYKYIDEKNIRESEREQLEKAALEHYIMCEAHLATLREMKGREEDIEKHEKVRDTAKRSAEKKHTKGMNAGGKDAQPLRPAYERMAARLEERHARLAVVMENKANSGEDTSEELKLLDHLERLAQAVKNAIKNSG